MGTPRSLSLFVMSKNKKTMLAMPKPRRAHKIGFSKISFTKTPSEEIFCPFFFENSENNVFFDPALRFMKPPDLVWRFPLKIHELRFNAAQYGFQAVNTRR
ncbi:hypothetical protein LJC24_02300 [Desulfococcaceae bacterium OttesenSCG-928-F15]|nr:hypothetical protein [Desulfococcaceae bacterium OttesenSCG-928-F15]